MNPRSTIPHGTRLWPVSAFGAASRISVRISTPALTGHPFCVLGPLPLLHPPVSAYGPRQGQRASIYERSTLVSADGVQSDPRVRSCQSSRLSLWAPTGSQGHVLQ